MPKIISVISRKGGVGKSTICSNLAIAAQDSTILDCDDQATLADWGDRRQQENPTIVPITAKRAGAFLKNVNTKWVFIDTPGDLNTGVIDILKISDFALIILRMGQFELDSISATLSAIQLTQVPAAIIINHLHPNANSGELIQELNSLGLPLPIAPIVIRQRADFQTAATLGLGVVELSRESKAGQEIYALWQWLEQEI
jgi:chromosome partitioning protein